MNFTHANNGDDNQDNHEREYAALKPWFTVLESQPQVNEVSEHIWLA